MKFVPKIFYRNLFDDEDNDKDDDEDDLFATDDDSADTKGKKQFTLHVKY